MFFRGNVWTSRMPPVFKIRMLLPGAPLHFLVWKLWKAFGTLESVSKCPRVLSEAPGRKTSRMNREFRCFSDFSAAERLDYFFLQASKHRAFWGPRVLSAIIRANRFLTSAPQMKIKIIPLRTANLWQLLLLPDCLAFRDCFFRLNMILIAILKEPKYFRGWNKFHFSMHNPKNHFWLSVLAIIVAIRMQLIGFLTKIEFGFNCAGVPFGSHVQIPDRVQCCKEPRRVSCHCRQLKYKICESYKKCIS